MSILSPGFLWLLLPLGIFFFYREKKLMETVHLFILICIVLALSRPVFIGGGEEAPIEGQSYIVALDVSYSMRAKDVKPDRYTFAKKTIAALLKENAADNIMLMAFTSNPLLLSPFTTDHRMIEVALQSLNPNYILTKGTSLKKLFKKVASMKEREKNLLLITDGGEERDTGALGEQIRKSGTHLTILALGTKEGMTIEKPDGSLLKDREGHLIVSRINPMLEILASETGGTYVSVASTPEATAKRLYRVLKAEEKYQEMQVKKQHRYTELFQIPLLFAVLLFLMLHTRAAGFLAIGLVLLGVSAEASILDGYCLNRAYHSYHAGDFNTSKAYLDRVNTPSLQRRFALGNIYYKEGAYAKALKTYASIRSTSPEIKQKLYYNMANCYTRQQAYEKAKIYYTKALQLGKDEDAAANLKLVALLADKQSENLGMAHPKSQNSGASKSGTQEKDDTKRRNEDAQSSGSGSGGENSKGKNEQEKRRLLLDSQAEQQPLSSKVYELINKGYIRETQPW